MQMEVQSSPSTFALSRFAQEHDFLRDLAILPGPIHGAPAFVDPSPRAAMPWVVMEPRCAAAVVVAAAAAADAGAQAFGL